jgi:AcrR family transcriptional regulator
MSTETTAPQTARERLLAAADSLFYEEGVHTVGIDRVIEEAGVAKASLYNLFGNKDGLVRAYLTGRMERRQDRTIRHLETLDSPRAKILGVFEVLEARVAEPRFRGCAFVNASAESEPGSGAREVSAAGRSWLRALFTDLARQAGATEPEVLGGQLFYLHDGAMVAAFLDDDQAAAGLARGAAEVLVDQALS